MHVLEVVFMYELGRGQMQVKVIGSNTKVLMQAHSDELVVETPPVPFKAPFKRLQEKQLEMLVVVFKKVIELGKQRHAGVFMVVTQTYVSSLQMHFLLIVSAAPDPFLALTQETQRFVTLSI